MKFKLDQLKFTANQLYIASMSYPDCWWKKKIVQEMKRPRFKVNLWMFLATFTSLFKLP